ncbi:hypothetical protein EYC84_008536 [Monilinia fructicola]|uniref:Bactericidal permeability-increasing protein n=1 Tax=Monilinia fructicola TaxID=38448 RepID=A0A5M9JK70_MONFR|nr:hypothetical protein EYC84_008536 [Monilinia fructicola]
MIKALSKGFMPSTEQVIVNLRTLLASDVLNPDNPELTDSGRRLLKFSKQWLSDFIELLRNKNDGDQIQDFIWFLIHSRISVNTSDLVERATNTRAKADASAAYASVKTVGSLLLTNSDFRIFLSDLNTIGRQVFADTAKTVSDVAEDAANRIEPSNTENEAMKRPGKERSEPIPTEDLQAEASASLKENISGEQRETLRYRLKEAVTKLKKRNDYSDSVNTIGLLIQRYAKAYSRAVDESISAVQDDIEPNPALDRAVENDPEFENLMGELAKSIQKMLSDPDFFDAAANKVEELKEKSKQSNTELFTDLTTVLIPMFITAIQYVPIPRLEISVPEIDLLLENLILEPGRTINHTSFLPYRLKIENLQRSLNPQSSIPYFLKSNFHRYGQDSRTFADEGIASFELDDRGIDIEFDVEIGHNQLEKILTLKDTRVKIHHLSYTLSKSKFACLAWIFKPLLRPIIRKTLEYQLSTALADFFHAANRELLYARERLRATRISSPDDIQTFIKAIITRLTPEEDPDVYLNVGVQGGAKTRDNVFKGVYAPGSVVRVWEREGRDAEQIVEGEGENNGGWRNAVFDVGGQGQGIMGW